MTASAKKKQRLLKPVKVRARCEQACSVEAIGTLDGEGVKNRSLVGLAELAPGVETTVKLSGAKNTDHRLEAIKEHGRKAKLEITVHASDGAGQSDVAEPLKVTLR